MHNGRRKGEIASNPAILMDGLGLANFFVYKNTLIEIFQSVCLNVLLFITEFQILNLRQAVGR